MKPFHMAVHVTFARKSNSTFNTFKLGDFLMGLHMAVQVVLSQNDFATFETSKLFLMGFQVGLQEFLVEKSLFTFGTFVNVSSKVFIDFLKSGYFCWPIPCKALAPF